nr:hypothetical protein CFP56_67636 [Quercus suber]
MLRHEKMSNLRSPLDRPNFVIVVAMTVTANAECTGAAINQMHSVKLISACKLMSDKRADFDTAVHPPRQSEVAETMTSIRSSALVAFVTINGMIWSIPWDIRVLRGHSSSKETELKCARIAPRYQCALVDLLSVFVPKLDQYIVLISSCCFSIDNVA